MPKKRTSQHGQILLVVILIMVVALTVGLSIASRTVTNLRTSTEESDSQKALNAAESGVEQALKANITPPATGTSLGNNATISQVNIATINGTNVPLSNGNVVAKDDGADIWLSTYPNYAAPQWNGSLTLSWGTAGTACSDAALEIIAITGTTSIPLSYRYAYDPCTSATRGSSNSFSLPSTGGAPGTSLDFSATININNGLIVRVIPLYFSSKITATTVAGNPLPAQGRIITSTGNVGTVARKIVYFQSYDAVPSEFFNSLFTPR